jgi:DnaJ-class molecular chaperone
MNIQQCYKVLEIDAHASNEEIKQAYKDIVNVWHPDRFAKNPRLKRKAETRIKEINEAYQTLSSYRSQSKKRQESSENSEKQKAKDDTRNDSHESGQGHVEAIFEVGTGLVLNFWAFMSDKVHQMIRQTESKEDKKS